jgi:hypothetical protein
MATNSDKQGVEGVNRRQLLCQIITPYPRGFLGSPLAIFRGCRSFQGGIY